MVHTFPKSVTPLAVSGGNGNSVNTASAPRSHTRHGVHDIGTLLARGQNGQNNNAEGVIVATIGQNNGANSVTLKGIGQHNAVNGVTIATVGQNNAANGITLKEIGKNNAVNGNTLEKIGQNINVNGHKIEDINSVSRESFSMNYYYFSPIIAAEPGKISSY
jgi:uncharacterized NAD(P)/FAD-binding protein YdhS